MTRHCCALIAAVVMSLSIGLGSPAVAAKEGKQNKQNIKKKAGAAKSHVVKHRRTATAPYGFRFQGGVPAGPLYNGQDYLGDDPDPNIRSQILRDLGSRYGGPE